MAEKNTKRIVFEAPQEEFQAVDDVAGRLNVSKVAAVRLAVSILSKMIDEMDNGQRIVLKDRDNNEREVWLPQLELRREGAK